MTLRPLGHVPDLPSDVLEDLRDRHVGALIGTSVEGLPARVDYSALFDVREQLHQSCVGWAFSTAIMMRAELAGYPIGRPSPKAIYDVARLLESYDVLVDTGSRPRLALAGITEYGLVAETRWPETAANANDKPPLDVFHAGLGALLTGHYRIGRGDVATLARSALAKGFPVFFAMQVDDAFMRMSDGAIYRGLTDVARGSHAMCLIGYDEESFLIGNSWGRNWGVGGIGRISDAALNQHAFDAIVVTTSPKRLA